MKTFLNRVLYRASGELPIRFIRSGDKPYMERYYVGKKFGVTAFLHRYIDGDGERPEVHDHPWDWSSGIVLTGGYGEERMTKIDYIRGPSTQMRLVKPLQPNIIWGDSFHRIATVKPNTWTLFIHGPKSKTWGFWVKQPSGKWLYDQPNDLASTQKWYETAQKGKQTLRKPLT